MSASPTAALKHRVAYHRHTGQPLGIVTESDAKRVRGTKAGRPFSASHRDVVLHAASVQQVAVWYPAIALAASASS